MKNLMDFCIGAVVFVVLGFGLMMGEEVLGGFCGLPTLGLLTDYAGNSANWSSFVFNLVFCATAATIVSGAMAERTKFISYCIYSGVISAVIYPIEAGWVWNSNGWLANLGFHDYAGSTVIHMVGGISALIGAAFLGPRIGKYAKDKKTGKLKAKAIPGHSLTLGALGVFILWFGWYGFNGAAATSPSELASIFMTTTIAPAVATVTTLLYTWIKNGKPDVSMCLNASLAGLVGITAGCAAMDALGATIVGIVSGILVVVVVEFLDLKLHIDDPVGAVGVHMANGIWGTIAVGLLANPDAPAGLSGLFYTGDPTQLGIQLIGIVAISVYTTIFMIITFQIIKKTNGLRASAEDEIAGLDPSEHGLPSSYADFMPAVSGVSGAQSFAAPVAKKSAPVSVEKAVTVEHFKREKSESGVKMTKVVILAKQSKFEELQAAMEGIGITGMTVTNVMGYGMQKGAAEYYRGVKIETHLLPKIKVEIVVCKVPVEDVVTAAKNALYTGSYGDGKIFVYDVENVVKIRTGEEDFEALQDEE